MEELIIVGSGPAGYTAALYAARANLKPVVVEGFMWGGLLQETTEVENFPGFPGGGILGPELMERMREQAQEFGARLITDMAETVEFSPGHHRVHVGGQVLESKAVIIATGAEHRKLGIPGEAELSGRGVSYCATCDAAFFRDRPVVVVGGGDSAMEEAIFLSKFATSVVIIHRRNEFRASEIMYERAKNTENISFMTPYVPAEFVAHDGALDHVVVINTETNEIEQVPAAGAFVAVGHIPNSNIFKDQLLLDDNGYIVVEGVSTKTSIPGVFACGDVVDHTYRQAITAAGSGCRAALDCEWYLRDL